MLILYEYLEGNSQFLVNMQFWQTWKYTHFRIFGPQILIRISSIMKPSENSDFSNYL